MRTVRDYISKYEDLKSKKESIEKSLKNIRNNSSNWIEGIEKDERYAVRILWQQNKLLEREIQNLLNTKIWEEEVPRLEEDI